MYNYDEYLHIHKIYIFYGINFLRNDQKLNDPLYHKILEKQHNKKFECRYFDITSMCNEDSILNIIHELRYWFPDDENFILFTNFLENILKYEIIYINID